MIVYKLGSSSPAVLAAFEYTPDQQVLSLFTSNGAQLDGFALHPVSYLNAFHLSSQVKFLRSIGFSDWNPDDSFNKFLHFGTFPRASPDSLHVDSMGPAQFDATMRSDFAGLVPYSRSCKLHTTVCSIV